MHADSPKRQLLVVGLLVLAALAGAGLRLLPYSLGLSSPLTPFLWNFTPALAMLIFGVASSRRPEFGLAAPFAMLVATDYVLHVTGMAATSPFDRAVVYGAYLLLGLLGLLLKHQRTWGRFALVCRAGPVGFFLLTSLGVWISADATLPPPHGYPKTLAGLVTCYAQALPFLRNDLIGTTLFAAALFGGYAWATRALPQLK